MRVDSSLHKTEERSTYPHARILHFGQSGVLSDESRKMKMKKETHRVTFGGKGNRLGIY
jgi:hypothetical protein